MRDGEFLTLDTDRIAAEANALAAQIQSALAARNAPQTPQAGAEQ